MLKYLQAWTPETGKKLSLRNPGRRFLPLFAEFMPVAAARFTNETEKRVIFLPDPINGLDRTIRIMKLEVDTPEQEKLEQELQGFLQWVEPMLAVNTGEAGQVLVNHDAVNVLREDRADQGELADLQEAAPEFAGGFYLVPPVIE